VLGDRNQRAAYDSRERWQGAGRRRSLDAAGDGSSYASRSTPTVIEIGRYAGRTIEAVAAVDSPYLEWLAQLPTAQAIRPKIEAVLRARRP